MLFATLDKVLNRFLECKLFINKVEFFRFIFSENGIAPS